MDYVDCEKSVVPRRVPWKVRQPCALEALRGVAFIAKRARTGVRLFLMVWSMHNASVHAICGDARYLRYAMVDIADES